MKIKFTKSKEYTPVIITLEKEEELHLLIEVLISDYTDQEANKFTNKLVKKLIACQNS